MTVKHINTTIAWCVSYLIFCTSHVVADDVCNCGALLSQIHGLEIKVRSLETQANSCHLLKEANELRERDAQRELALKEERVLQEQQVDHFRKQLLMDARAGKLTIDGFSKLLAARSKTVVSSLLGPPPQFRIGSGDERLNDFWRYPRQVVIPESPGVKWDLWVKFTSGFVSGVYSKPPENE